LGVDCDNLFLWPELCRRQQFFRVAQDRRNKFACVELIITASTKDMDVIFGEHNINLTREVDVF
jgi:hypothetical protein